MAVGYLLKKFPAMYVIRRSLGAYASLGCAYYSRPVHRSVYACDKKRTVEPICMQLHTM